MHDCEVSLIRLQLFFVEWSHHVGESGETGRDTMTREEESQMVVVV